MIQVAEPQVSTVDPSKMYVRIQNDMLTDLLSAVQYYVEAYSIWDHDPLIKAYQGIDGNFYAYMSWKKEVQYGEGD